MDGFINDTSKSRNGEGLLLQKKWRREGETHVSYQGKLPLNGRVEIFKGEDTVEGTML